MVARKKDSNLPAPHPSLVLALPIPETTLATRFVDLVSERSNQTNPDQFIFLVEFKY